MAGEVVQVLGEFDCFDKLLHFPKLVKVALVLTLKLLHQLDQFLLQPLVLLNELFAVLGGLVYFFRQEGIGLGQLLKFLLELKVFILLFLFEISDFLLQVCVLYFQIYDPC